MAEDYNCPLCGKHFVEEEDLDSHNEQDHPEFNETYGKKATEQDTPYNHDENSDWSLHQWEEDSLGEGVLCTICGKYADFDEYARRNLAGETDEEHPRINISYGYGDDAKSVKNFDELRNIDKKEDEESIDVQDQPLQSHDEWQKELDSLKDEFEGKENEERPWTFGKTEDDKTVIVPTRDEAEEEGADDPLKKVADLAESYRYMSRDKRASLFESLGFTQGDSAILSGLEWNELTRPIKVEASEAYIKEYQEPEPKEETGEDPEEEENEIYENFYNLEKHHHSPDYKKKAIGCNRCNETFYNKNDRDIHFNEVHATEQEYELPEECPLCDQIIQEPETLDWHMQEQHGAHVPSQFTQTGIAGAMADTDFDALESYAKEFLPEDYQSMSTDELKERKKGIEWEVTMSDASNTWARGRSAIALIDQELRKRGESTESYAREGLKEDVYNFIKIQGEVPAYPSMLTGLGIDITSEELTNIIKELEAEGKISSGFANRTAQDYPPERSPFITGTTLDDLGDSGEWTWKAEAKEDYSSIFSNPFNYDCYRRCSVCGADVDACSEDGSRMTDVNLKQHYDEHKARGEIPSFESYAKEDGMYANFGNKDKDDSWSVLTVGSDLLYFNTREEAEDYVSNYPEGTYQINRPRSGKESARESRISDLKEEKKKLQNFIRYASIENPLNIGAEQQRLDEINAELASLGEAYHFDLEDTTEYPDDPEEEEKEEATEQYECETCGEDFDDSEALQEHQYANWHGEYEDDYEGQGSPRNVMGGW